jgi:hypothetical protein
MRDYRLFRFHRVSGLASEEIIRARDHIEAKRIMREKADGADCELWLDTTLIGLVSGNRD